MRDTYFIDTMGCQMNERDSETIAGVLEDLGFARTEDMRTARVIVLNTCAVREKPVHKVFSKLGGICKMKAKRPEMIIIVAGCVAQMASEELRERTPLVDVVVGPRNLSGLAEAVRQATGEPSVLADTSEVIPEGLPFSREDGVNAFVNVTYGCDNFCAYCIVPYTRGREQSRTPERVITEVQQVVATGRPDVTLLGQNVNSYRGTNESGQPVDFPALLALVDSVDGLKRLRFTTSHPKDLSLELLDTMRDLPTVCEHLHLPIQSGDDEVLARMGRNYTRAHYMDILQAARERIPDIAITTDVMVGFPGETEQQSENTVAAFEEIRYDQAFMFMYNDRPGTRASEFEDKVPEPVKLARLQRLVDIQNTISRENNERFAGNTYEVLVGGPDPKSPSRLRGRSRTNKLVIFTPRPALGRATPVAGDMVFVRTEQAFLWGFTGTEVIE